MERPSYKLNLTGKNLSEVYSLDFPDNLIKFIKYDFEPFVEQCVQLCRTSMKAGSVNFDEVAALRNSISACHKYFEKNIRGLFEKIVFDCWIDYICRQNGIGYSTLWNSFSACRNEFESLLFARLCEERYNHAINQWNNLLKMQEYAQKKVDFVFGKKLENRDVAAAKSGYFDLLFSIAANEMGCRELSTSKVYSGMRTPNAPFVMSTLSREIMRNILGGVNFDEAGTFPGAEIVAGREFIADKSAMDVFSVIKDSIPEEFDSMISVRAILRSPEQVYIPESFKSVIDLEIDALLESGGILQKCGRCLEYYLKDEKYNYDYCSRIENGRSCIEIMDEKMAALKSLAPVDSSLLHSRCEQLYKEMAERVNVDMNQRDFSDWYKYMVLIRENVISGQAAMDDFENFVEYSRAISFNPKAAYKERRFEQREPIKSRKSTNKKSAPEHSAYEPLESHETREVHAFEFERIDTAPVFPPSYPSSQSSSSSSLSEISGIPTLNPQQSAFFETPLEISPKIPPYAPTTRVIRGVVPPGVNVIGAVKEIPTETPKEIPKESPAEMPEVIQTEILKEISSDFSETGEMTETSEKSKATEIFETTPEIPETAQIAQATSPPKPAPLLRLEKYGEVGVPQNPHLREIIAPSENYAENHNQVETRIQKEVKPIKSDESVAVDVSAVPPQLDFNSILSGIRRNDGFERTSNPRTSGGAKTPTISAVTQNQGVQGDEEVAVSHKTKRVMDMIFGKSKTINPFVKQEEDE
ncbi:MAG: hypothetical protein FWG83_04985 [Oscillospiraceae bacterium]|nr:hypothetical protein [Oscillospiraceae bacterium]